MSEPPPTAIRPIECPCCGDHNRIVIRFRSTDNRIDVTMKPGRICCDGLDELLEDIQRTHQAIADRVIREQLEEQIVAKRDSKKSPPSKPTGA